MGELRMIADIASGNTATADVFFLIAVIVFGVAALAYVVPFGSRTVTDPPRHVYPFGAILTAIGLACVALAWLVL